MQAQTANRNMTVCLTVRCCVIGGIWAQVFATGELLSPRALNALHRGGFLHALGVNYDGRRKDSVSRMREINSARQYFATKTEEII